MKPWVTTRSLIICCLCACLFGCLGWFEGTQQTIGYVLAKGDAEAIGQWTVRQTDGRKIHDGLFALCYLTTNAHSNEESRDAISWYVLAVNKIEDWSADQVVPATTGEHFTTGGIVQWAFEVAADDAYNHPKTEELFRRLRPDENHKQWLGDWEQSAAKLEREKQRAQNVTAGTQVKPATTRGSSP